MFGRCLVEESAGQVQVVQRRRERLQRGTCTFPYLACPESWPQPASIATKEANESLGGASGHARAEAQWVAGDGHHFELSTGSR